VSRTTTSDDEDDGAGDLSDEGRFDELQGP